MQHLDTTYEGYARQPITTASILERTARQLTGPLAQAIAGDQDGKPVRALFLGDVNMVSPTVARLLGMVAWANRHLPVLAKLLQTAMGSDKVYGNLLTTMLFGHKQVGDSVVLESDPRTKLLRQVILQRANRENIVLRVVEDRPGQLEQILYFGKVLADNNDRLALRYEYDQRLGALKSLGSRQVVAATLLGLKEIELAQIQIAPETVPLFERLTGQSLENSLCFPVNSGVLQPALSILRDPALGIDFERIVIYGLDIAAAGNVMLRAGDCLQMRLEPLSLHQTEKGELVQCAIRASHNGILANTATIQVMVRGNLPKSPDWPLPHIARHNWHQMTGHRTLEIKLMDKPNLEQFALLNGDHNPLHQVDGVAQAVGFRERVCPALGIIAQIEAALRSHFANRLTRITGTFIRPGYPGTICSLDLANSQSPGAYVYQLRQPGSDGKILSDGQFWLGVPKR